mmetsp:Transcript_63274/g.150913  ORF Transcript_63274/g.150913 Transcript_63274/m.150913 type:complete len:629 (-) Transcript_63274:33-1919(-)|eukprot:CAMPEP_0178416336 /NCGR_PEP_ID=MMETSP0689_2-20121128/24013_1 /TAXON_ID=160604 /ORGANISM="Amphidinium massartii, Strain CS-259" /LENGTH=628 /DNA_ID=CAMNT_0020037681 /DNA_START=1 /DNA_END=1887 /DNA_ORIENTATION=+
MGSAETRCCAQSNLQTVDRTQETQFDECSSNCLARDALRKDYLQFRFPMHVVGVKHVIALEELIPHEKFVSSGKLKDHHNGTDVLFVSHQWMSREAPDKNMAQFRVLQKALQGLTEGWLKPLVCPSTTEASGQTESVLTREAAADLINSYVWYDYLCVPQRPQASVRAAVVESVAAYLAASKFLIVLAPTLPCDDGKSVYDSETWQARGWCRFERLVFGLTRKKVDENIIFVVHHAGLVQECVGLEGIQVLPHRGTWGLTRDKSVTDAAIGSVVRERLVHLFQQQSLFEYRLALAMGRYYNNCLQTESDLSAWLLDFHFTPSMMQRDQGDDAGWFPLHFAAVQGNLQVVKLLILAGVDVDVESTEPIACLAAHRGMTPMMAALLYIPDETVNLEVVKCLVQLGADIHRANAAGQAAIHCACRGVAAASSIKHLISLRADVDARDVLGETPLHRACGMSTLFSTSRYEYAKALLEAGAEIHRNGGVLDMTPFHYAAAGSRALVELFLSRGADPNWQLEESKRRRDLARKVQVFEQESTLAVLALHGTGLTPLMISAWFGNWPACEAMLRHGAKVNLRTASGRKAADWLVENHVKEGPTLQLLLGAGSAPPEAASMKLAMAPERSVRFSD